MPNPKAKALLADMQKRFGDNKVMMASEIPVGPPISTGSLALDVATGYGGFPSDRVVELYGKEATGKTTMALLTMVNALEMYPDKMGLFIDLEHKVTKDWIELIIGADLLNNRVMYSQATTIEEATNIYRQAVGSGQVCIAILDSIGGAPTVRSNEDAQVARVGGNAIGVGEFARSAATWSSTYNCLTIGINQVRSLFNSRIPGLVDTPGGHAWRHACVLRVEMARGGDTELMRFPGEEKPVTIGYTVFGKIRKNQVGAPGRTATWWFFNIWTPEWGFGIDRQDEILRLGTRTGVIELRGGWYYHQAFPKDSKGEHKVQGLSSVKKLVRADDSLRQTLSSEILASLKDHISEVAPISDPNAPVVTEEPQ